MNQDRPRRHHDIGSVPRSVRRAVDTGPHPLSGTHPEGDAPRQIRGIGSTSAAEDRRFAGDLSRSGTIVEVDFAAAPGGMSGTGPRVSADVDACVRVRDAWPMDFGTVRQRMPRCRDGVLQRLGLPETTADLHGLIVGDPCPRIARDRRGLQGGWHGEPPAAQHIRAIVPTGGQSWIAPPRRPAGTAGRQEDGPAAPLDEGHLFAVTVPRPEGATP